MFKKSILGAALISATMLAGNANAATAEDFKAAHEAAEAARKGAAALKYEWRDTGKMIKKAKALAEKGEFDKAVKLANKAREQGELAQAQAKEQEKSWRDAVLK